MNLLDKPTTLNELYTSARALDGQLTLLSAEAHELTFEANAIRYQGHSFGLTKFSRNRLLQKLHAPVSYFEKHDPRFVAAAFAEHARRGDFGMRPVIVARDIELVTLAQGNLRSLNRSDVVTSVQEELGKEGESLSVARIAVTEEGRLDVDLVSPLKSITVRQGDIVQAGIHVDHDRFGTSPTVIEAFMLRMVCSNGLVRRECSGNGAARTRRLPLNSPNSRELQMDQIRRLTRVHWNGLQAKLEVLRNVSQRPVEVEELLRRWLERARISPRLLMGRLLSAWQEDGSDATYWGAVNAITAVATHDHTLSARQRRTLATLAGLLSFAETHLCPRCWSVLSQGLAHTAEAA